jgi:hypothetical protein
MRDDEIDLTDIPEITDAQWALAVRGSDLRAARAAGREPELCGRPKN